MSLIKFCWGVLDISCLATCITSWICFQRLSNPNCILCHVGNYMNMHQIAKRCQLSTDVALHIRIHCGPENTEIDSFLHKIDSFFDRNEIHIQTLGTNVQAKWISSNSSSSTFYHFKNLSFLIIKNQEFEISKDQKVDT